MVLQANDYNDKMTFQIQEMNKKMALQADDYYKKIDSVRLDHLQLKKKISPFFLRQNLENIIRSYYDYSTFPKNFMSSEK